MVERQEYVPVFRMQVSHEYSAGTAYRTFTVSPARQTGQTLDRFGFACAQADGQFSLYAGGSRLRALSHQDARATFAATDLTFTVSFTDADFVRYTDLPWRDGSRLVFASPWSPVQTDPLRLTARPFVSADDLWPVHAGPFCIPLSSAVALPDPYEVIDRRGHVVTRLAAPAHGRLAVDLGPWMTGFFTVRQGGNAIYRCLVATDIFCLPSVALIVISGARILDDLNFHSGTGTVTRAGDLLPPVHTVVFRSRATVWRYNIFNHGGGNPDEFSVGGEGCIGQPIFSRVAGPGEGDSIAFESDPARPIPMRVRPTQRFQLLKRGRVVLDPLPTPGLTLGGGPTRAALRSEMFVYL